jgi:acyl-CoA synthetase (AMP-forming)/AMP-acid ligase II
MGRFGIERAVLWQGLREAAAGARDFNALCILEHVLPASAMRAPVQPPPPAAPAPDDPAYVQFSSGSTARPKGVVITHRNVVYNLAWAVGDAPRESGHTGLTWLPLYHDMGLVGGFLSNLLLPNPVVLMHTLCFLMKPVSWLEAITRFRVDGTNCPNFALDVCAWRIPERDLDRRRIDLRSWKYLGLGAEPIRTPSVERFVKRFKRFGFDPLAVHPGYGMAEATLMATSISYREGLTVRRVDGARLVSVGRPVGDTELRILDPDGRQLGAGRVGEVALRGTSVSPGYLDAPQETAASFRDGWFHTGDLGTLDDQGRLYITGRLKDLIIIQGRNVYGHEIAHVVEALPAVAKGKVYAFGVERDGREGVVVLAVPARRPPAQMGKRAELVARGLGLTGLPGRALGWVLAILGTLAGRFRRLEVPEIERRIRSHLMKELGLAVEDVLLVTSIPKTTSGKVKRDACEELYRQSRA